MARSKSTTTTAPRTSRKSQAAAPPAPDAPSTATVATPKAPPVLRECGCGCGTPGTGRFRPGHDAKLHGRVRRIRLGMPLPSGLSDGEVEAAEAAAGEYGDGGIVLGGSFAAPPPARIPQTKEQRAIALAKARVERLDRELAEARVALAALLGESETARTEDLLAAAEDAADEAMAQQEIADGTMLQVA